MFIGSVEREVYLAVPTRVMSMLDWGMSCVIAERAPTGAPDRPAYIYVARMPHLAEEYTAIQ